MSAHAEGRGGLKLETVTLDDKSPAATVQLLYRPAVFPTRPVILMLGSLEVDKPPFWSDGLLDEGYLLAAFSVAHPPDPDPARRPQWLVFDQRFAHGYALGGSPCRRMPGASSIISLRAQM